MQKLKLDKQSIVFIVLAAFLTVEVFLLLPWGLRKISVLNSRTAKIVQDVFTVEKEWPRKDDYIKRKAELAKRIDELEQRLLSPQEESKLLSFISSSSKDFSVEIDAISPEAVQSYLSVQAGELKYLPMDIKAKANFHDFARFLDFLQRSDYFIEVKKLRIFSSYPYNSIEAVLCGMLIEEK